MHSMSLKTACSSMSKKPLSDEWWFNLADYEVTAEKKGEKWFLIVRRKKVKR